MAVTLGPGSATQIINDGNIGTSVSPWDGSTTKYASSKMDGFDLIYMQTSLQTQMNQVQTDIQNIESNANLSDTEKMFSMQMAMNTWSAIANLRTNMLKSISDTLKTITRNVN